MKTLEPNNSRSKAVISMIWIILILDIVSLLSNYLQFLLLSDMSNGATVEEQTLQNNDFRQWVISIIYIIAFIISAAAFIRWFKRAYSNLALKMPNQLDYSVSSTVYCWFIPFVNFYLPYVIMKSMYTNTDKYLIYKGNENYTEQLKTNYLGWWWFLWIMSRLTFKITNKTSIFTNILDSTVIDMLSNGFSIILAIITIIVIKDYANAEKILFDVEEEERNLVWDESDSSV